MPIFLATALLAASPAMGADTSALLAGYGQASLGLGLDEGDLAFDEVLFAPVFLWREADRVLVEAELEFAQGADGFEAGLEYAAINLDTGGPVVTAGQFLSPAGQFMVRLHPSWINKFYDFPLPYRVGPLPMAHVGVQAQQVVRPGLVDRLVLLAWVDNGPGGSEGAPSLAPRVVDDNLDKGLGGRIALFPVPGVELAASGYTGAYAADSGERFALLVVDAAWSHGAWLDLRGEFMRATWAQGEFVGAWAQAGWRLRQVEVLSRLEPVIRFGWAGGDTPAAAEPEAGDGGHGHGASGVSLGAEPVYELCAGLNYYLRSNVVLKLSESHGAETYDHRIHGSVALGF